MNSQFECTFVTALYNIGRENYDGRTIDNYKHWLQETLKLQEPVIIFIDETIEGLEELINNCRREINEPTLVIVTSLVNIPCFWMLEDVKRIINDQTFIRKHPDDITNLNPLYVCIQYSKFEWIKIASQKITWETKYYAWIDAGISRFYPRGMSKFNSHFIIQNDNVSCFILHKTNDTQPKLIENKYFDKNKLIGTNQCLLRGTMFFATIDCLEEIIDKIYDCVQNDMISKNRIDNEQIALSIIVNENPHYFVWIESDGNFLHKNIFS